MSYFEKFNDTMHYPIARDDTRGLRRAQKGAAFSIYSHFTLRSDAAIVVMPTGSGKTAILMMSAFLLQANRVLVVTPSVLVRGQISRQFSNLSLLRDIGVLDAQEELPKVHEMKNRPTDADWERLHTVDVVIATPQSISPHYSAVDSPPPDFFDVLLIDEAHHSPASTWDAILRSFPNAKRVLFTATPFRMDRHEIIGKVVYNYTVRQAYEDKVFGDIEFHPVLETGDDTDAAIALAAQETFRRDRDDGYDHVLMVRTGTKKRAKELLTIYEKHTDLKLRVVDSNQTVNKIEQALKDLGGPDLDGIICVDMLGEGFDFPNLKIAALHTPHKSLAVTLQFIGRFARTNAPNLGKAKFIAVPSEVEGETSEIFGVGAIWQDIISNLSERRISDVILDKEVIEEFDEPVMTTPDTCDVPLYALSPQGHFKVFKIQGTADLAAKIKLPPQHEIIFEQHAPILSALVIVTQERHHPKWTNLEVFTGTAYNLIIIYYDQDHQLLFINSSQKADLLYDNIVSSVSAGAPRPIPLNQVRRVLGNLTDLNVYNVGMRSNVLNGNSVSYQTKAGSSAGMGIQPTDGLTHSLGHAFCRGKSHDGELATIGYSASSRFWTSESYQIPSLMRFCKRMAAQIADENCNIGNSGLDHLSCGESVTSIPPHVIAADWYFDTYVSPPMMSYALSNGEMQKILITDAILKLDRVSHTSRSIRVLLEHNSHTWSIDFSLDNNDYFSPAPGLNWTECKIRRRNSDISLLEYLNAQPLSFYFADCSRLEKDQLFRRDSGSSEVIRLDCLEAIDWKLHKVDITKEYGTAKAKHITLHDYLSVILENDKVDVVYRDHTQGEIADFITLGVDAEELHLTLYHCKGSGGSTPGQRVGDVYEVVGQVLKSIPRVQKPDVLLADLKRRNKQTNRFIKGDEAKLSELFSLSKKVRTRHSMVIVQPGISKSAPHEESMRVIAACADYLERVDCERLRVWSSE